VRQTLKYATEITHYTGVGSHKIRRLNLSFKWAAY